jgi:hypothetical protein
MNAGPFASLISEFAQNWAAQGATLSVSLAGAELDLDSDHPLHGELFALCSGRSASLPFFPTSGDVVWCTLAPDADSLRQAVTTLGAWVFPSLGGTTSDDGYTRPGSSKGAFTLNIIAASPDGYYRWRCPNYDRVFKKLQLLRRLENVRPPRDQPPRPSLYELRARFASALLVGNRNGAEETISQLDLFQLETAANTQFMRIRMWHHFGELDRIRHHPDLPHLLAQALPPRIRAWINEACGASNLAAPTFFTTTAPTPAPTALPASAFAEPSTPVKPQEPQEPPINNWLDWFVAVKAGRRAEAETFLQEVQAEDEDDFSTNRIEASCICLDELALDDALRARERAMILPAVAEILERYVREANFPRPNLASFYLSLLRTWSLLHRGNSAGQEHGHVLLELASALLQLNANTAETCQALEEWWKAKPTPSQLYFALDAIELMERELPDPKPAVNLWIEAAAVTKRAADALPVADKELWRRVGLRMGFDQATIYEYLPPDPPEEETNDPLASTELKHIAIVCLREKQAKQAAEEIKTRSGAKVTVVTDAVAGGQTTQACTADVVLFVWLASTHPVFRAFDGFDRQRFCYVQGTGASSIVRALERWNTTIAKR